MAAILSRPRCVSEHCEDVKDTMCGDHYVATQADWGGGARWNSALHHGTCDVARSRDQKDIGGVDTCVSL